MTDEKIKSPGQNQKTYDETFEAFIARYPLFKTTQKLDQLRRTEYHRLDRQAQIYLDYTGGGLYTESQLHTHFELLRNNVFGNPHSHNPTSLAMTELVDQARAYVLEYFNASPDEYFAIFTPNASGALKLVGESYPFTQKSRYVLSFDNHNSVNGIREFARARGANICYIPVVPPDLRLDQTALEKALNTIDTNAHNLFAFPAQSNFSGVQHPLRFIQNARDLGWDVLLDAAAFAPTNRMDINRWKPDFATFSFYKIFGYPTGLGCLIMRKDKLEKLQRPWFAGGTITIASVQGDGHFLLPDEAAFEDGTIDYLNIPAIETGLRYINSVGIDIIHDRVTCLSGWLIDQLTALRHDNGAPFVHLHGPRSTDQRGGTITITLHDPEGIPLDDHRIEELANHRNISIRTGCFCNPGAGEITHGLSSKEMSSFFQIGKPISFMELRKIMGEKFNKSVSAIRISVGIASTFDDVHTFILFIKEFLNKHASEVGFATYDQPSAHTRRDTT